MWKRGSQHQHSLKVWEEQQRLNWTREGEEEHRSPHVGKFACTMHTIKAAHASA